MTISTSLIEFEESLGIKAFFELENPSISPVYLYIVLEDRLMASLEIVRGTLEEEIDLFLEKSIESEVNGLSGFISKLDLDFPYDLNAKFDIDKNEINQYHMFKFGEISLTAHLNVLGDWHEGDLEKFRSFLEEAKLIEESNIDYEFGEILGHKDFEESLGSKVGKRNYLGNQLISIE